MISIHKVIELSDDLSSVQIERLLNHAYLSSRCSPTILLVGRESKMRAERALDDVVSRFGVRRPGVLFVERDGECEDLDYARRANTVVASSESFESVLREARIPFLTPEEALRQFDSPTVARTEPTLAPIGS